MYVDGDRLVLAGNISSSSLEQESEDVYYMENYTGAVADTYDISISGIPGISAGPGRTAGTIPPGRWETICICSAHMPYRPLRYSAPMRRADSSPVRTVTV